MVQVENRVGRVTLVRIESPVTPADLTKLILAVTSITMKLKVLLTVIDARNAEAFEPDIEKSFSQLTTTDNPVLLSRAILVKPATKLQAQAERMVAKVASGKTTIFTDPVQLGVWASRIMTPPEAQDVNRFLLNR